MKQGRLLYSYIKWGQSTLLASLALAFVVMLNGCEIDSFMDPSVMGRWERTPVVLPILDQLDIIDEPESTVSGLTQVHPDDLVPVIHEYVIGPGDLVTVTVFELIVPNAESVQTRRVDELGILRLPVIGSIEADDQTPSQLERRIRRVLEDNGILKDAMVSVIVQEKRQNTYSVIGEPRLSGTAIGTYSLQQSDFRLLDAMALARGVSGGIKKIYIIRQAELTGPEGREVIQTGSEDHLIEDDLESLDDPTLLIEDLLGEADELEDQPNTEPQATQNQDIDPPSALEHGLDGGSGTDTPWVNIDGQWVRVDPAVPDMPGGIEAEGSPVVTQRIIEVPYDKLLDGDMRYNVVIRPGDVIRVPPPVIGNVYIGGAISRPGTYALPGDRDLTLKQLIFAAGNVSPIAIPERVDLVRRVGGNQEAIVRLNLRAIFDGTQPDFYLKPNDTINIGTNYMATPLAVARNGFRMSYGFGFILDRNFGPDVYGPVPDDN